MAAPPTARWLLCLRLPLFLLLLLLQGSGVGGQLTLGSADSFLPEHLDANAAATTGKTLEVTPLSDASDTNAAVTAAAAAAAAETASDLSSPGASQAGDSLIFPATDSPAEETTLPDFDDYTADETETTTNSLSPPDNGTTHPGGTDHPHHVPGGEQGTEEVTTASSLLTRRIVYTGPEATATTPLPSLQSTRPASVLRELDDLTTDLWRPNWPSQLLGSTEDPTRRPSIRFPTGLPTASLDLDTTAASPVTPTPAYTVTKVPVTQYYFDLASASPTAVPGPLFDPEDDGTSASALSSVLPDLTRPLEPEDLSSSLSELQSSVLVGAAEPPVTPTPALPHSMTSPVITSEAQPSISASAATQTLSPTSTAQNEVVEGHLDNTLDEEAEAEGDTTVKENPEASEVMPFGTGPTQSGLGLGLSLGLDHSENTTAAEDPDSLYSPANASEAPQSTSSSQPVTQSPTVPAPPTNSEPLDTTSSTTPGSVKPSSVRTSQGTKSSRIPLWQRLSQSSPSRSVTTPPSSTPLTPSVAATPAADPVTPLTSAPPPPSLQSTPIEPPMALDDSTAPTLTPSPPGSESTQEPVIPDDSDPSTPLDIDDPDEILTKTMRSDTGNVSRDSTEPPIAAPETPTEPPLGDTTELGTHTEAPQNTTTPASSVDTHLPANLDQHTSVDNNSTVEVVDNALDGTHPNIFSGDNTPENITRHGNGIFDNPKADENDPLLTPARDANDSVVEPTEVLVTSPPTVSVTWTPVMDVTESVPTPTSTSLVLNTNTTTVASQAPPELLSGFTPILSSTHTAPASRSEVVAGGSLSSASSASPADSVGSTTSTTTTTTTTTSAPAPDLSTPPAPSPTLPASLAPTAVQKTDTTDDSIPTLLPQPAQPEDGGEEGTHGEVPEKESAPEHEMEPPPPTATPLPSPAPPDTTTTTTTAATTTTTTASSTTSTTTTTTETVPATESPTAKPATAAPDTTTASTTASTSPTPTMNSTTLEPGAVPTLTTTTVLENGTSVVVELPYIRALVDYNTWQFCKRKHDFRSMFAEWITQDLNGSVQVAPRDIMFFAMADCPASLSARDQLPPGHEDAITQEENHTHVYFYVTTAGEVDPELTEKFPLFPTDLVISEDLVYLVPRVMELEVVRPDESSNQDQLQEAAVGTSVIVIIVICSIVGVTIIVALFFFMVVKRRGATNNYYGRRCTPVSMDAYSMDSVSVYHSFRRKSKRRASGRSMKSYLNQAFDDPNGPSRPLNFAKLTHFISDIDGVHEEFATIPVNMPKYDELPSGVEDKNRYANVIPVPETRVLLKVTKDGRSCEYINANFVRGARNESKYYIATQAPLDDTVADFWRMIWEQETRVVVMLTDFVEKGIDKCADYLPPSETLDCHRLYGDFQVTLKSRDMREKFVVSNVQLKNLENNLQREVAHMWFTGWPAAGVPNEEGAFISFILEVRRTRKKLRAKGPIVIHCSPGTGRTGTLLASDVVMKQFEEHRTIDVPRTVYAIRRDRAGAVQTKEQYAFIYRVINLYASKLTSGNLESL